MPEKILKPYINKSGRRQGYKQVHLSNNTREYVHRIVAKMFVENPLNYSIINNIDDNTLNNHFSNLEWCTYSQNRIHSRDILEHGISSKTAFDLLTGVFYDSLIEAFKARVQPVKFSQFTLMLRNEYPNITNIITI